jgi:hypothetical protein
VSVGIQPVPGFVSRAVDRATRAYPPAYLYSRNSWFGVAWRGIHGSLEAGVPGLGGVARWKFRLVDLSSGGSDAPGRVASFSGLEGGVSPHERCAVSGAVGKATNNVLVTTFLWSPLE